MQKPCAVVVFPGSNCERDLARALELILGRPPLRISHKETALPDLGLVVLPGGFSWGDYLRVGAIAARAPVMREVARCAEAGVPILGICNGFQILTEAGLLPGALLSNRSLKFVCRKVHLRIEPPGSVFTSSYAQQQVIDLPVAHADGLYYADRDTLKRLDDRGQVALRYCNAAGEPVPEACPNGSLDNIAGVYNQRRNILGLMPHPERAVEPLHGNQHGCLLFESLRAALD